MILKNNVIWKVILLGLELLVFLALLLASVRVLYVRFLGEKENVVVENIKRNGFRSPYSIASVYFNGGKREVYFCPNKIKNGTEIEVYNSDSLNLMFYAKISNRTVILHLVVLLISIVAIYSLLFMKDD